MSDYHQKSLKYIKGQPEETVVIWTKPEHAKASGADYNLGQTILTNWIEHLRSIHEHAVADHIEWLNRGNSKSITLPCADPSRLYGKIKGSPKAPHWTDI